MQQEEFYDLVLKREQAAELSRILKCNEGTASYGLELTEEEAQILLMEQRQMLRKQQRVEFGTSILPKLIDTFCDSPFLTVDTYADTLTELMELFYQFKNETLDLVNDEELLNFMAEQFNDVCSGSTEYLAETCMERFGRAVRKGYQGYQKSSGKREYEQFSEETHWERELYDQAMKELVE